MNLREWVAVSGCLLASITAIYSIMRVMVRAIMSELQPNGGASLRDQVNRIERRLDSLYEKISE
jgi:hypothetical protein